MGIFKLQVKQITADNNVNIAPPVQVWFAVIPDLNEEVIITPSVAKLLQSVSSYDIPADVSNVLDIEHLVQSQSEQTELCDTERIACAYADNVKSVCQGKYRLFNYG